MLGLPANLLCENIYYGCLVSIASLWYCHVRAHSLTSRPIGIVFGILWFCIGFQTTQTMEWLLGLWYVQIITITMAPAASDFVKLCKLKFQIKKKANESEKKWSKVVFIVESIFLEYFSFLLCSAPFILYHCSLFRIQFFFSNETG